MPLGAYVPVIDNRRYDDIVTELRTRIPRYTSEWTDFNDSDPGITLDRRHSSHHASARVNPRAVGGRIAADPIGHGDALTLAAQPILPGKPRLCCRHRDD